MLEPRRADVAVLFMFLVVLPVVVYILLGKWTEASKRKKEINLSFQQAAVRSSPEAMATANDVVPIVPSVNPAFRDCARCRARASTRCARCKSVRYCSGKCQILHWRQGHKDDCRPSNIMSLSLRPVTIEEAGFPNDFTHAVPYPEFNAHSSEQTIPERVQSHASYSLINPSTPSSGAASVAASASVNGSWNSVTERRVSEKPVMRKSTRGTLLQSYGTKKQNNSTSTKKYVNHYEVGGDCSVPSMNGPSAGSSFIDDLQQKKNSA